MSNASNFILKVHIQDKELKEVFLNKDKRCFTFIDDECVADLVLPEFKLTSLKMLIKNVVDDKENSDYYAEYDNDGTTIFEYDKEKVKLLSEMVTKITIKDFLEYIDRVKQNDFYIDNIVDIYNATIPEEVKRLVSYTTNGFKFNESDLRMLGHEEILDSDFRKDKFIPIFESNNDYYGFDLKERKYAKYVNGEIYKFYDKLAELLDFDKEENEEEKEELEIIDATEEKVEVAEEPIEIIDMDEEEKPVKKEKTKKKKKNKEENIYEMNMDKVFEETPIEVKKPQEENAYEMDMDKVFEESPAKVKVQEEEEESLFAIITDEDKKETPAPVVEEVEDEKPKKKKKKKKKSEAKISEEEKAAIKKEIDDEYNRTIKNINNQFEKLNTQVETKKDENVYEMDVDQLFSNYKTEVVKPNIYKMDLDKLFKEAQTEVKKQKETNAYEMDIENLFKDKPIEVKKPQEENIYEMDVDQLFKDTPIEVKKPEESNIYQMDLDGIFSNYKTEVKPVKEEPVYELEANKIFTNFEFVPKKVNSSEIKHTESAYSLGKDNLFKEEQSRYQLMKTKFDINPDEVKLPKETEYTVSKDITDNIRDSVKKSLKKIEKEELAEIDLERLIDNSLTDSINNYRIKYNDSMKLVVEHIPYYEDDNSFGVVQIPELEVNKYTLLPDGVLDFDRLKFNVLSLSDEKLELLIEKATNIVTESGDKVKRGDIVKMDSSTTLIYLLDKKDAMESWTFRMEKAVYDKELRHIEYNKLLNFIKAKTNYETLANIEKIETQKSIMLFINTIMNNHEYEKIDELYKVIKDGENYAKFITEYNNITAHNDKDSLPSYDHKKDFLEKLKYVNTLISTDALTYPRYIYASFNYFDGEQILEDYIEDVHNSVRENDFSNYLKGLFKQNGIFTGLDDEGKDNLNKCLEYLSALYKHHPTIGEEDKYKIENTLIVTLEDEDMALLISKLCRKGIKDYNSFKEYDSLMKEEYRTGNLKYPLYSEDFDIEEVRKGGEYDE